MSDTTRPAVPSFGNRDPNSPGFWDEGFKEQFMPWDQAGAPDAFRVFVAEHDGQNAAAERADSRLRQRVRSALSGRTWLAGARDRFLAERRRGGAGATGGAWRHRRAGEFFRL